LLVILEEKGRGEKPAVTTISMKQKKWLLVLHLIFSAIMLGTSVVLLILSITAATVHEPGVLLACYTSMHVLSETSMRASTIGTIVTGILLSVWTHWGLLKYYWIIAKEVLTAATILLGPIGIYMWTLRGIALIDSPNQGAFIANSLYLFIGIGLQIASLVAMFVISVFKPWGKRGRVPKRA